MLFEGLSRFIMNRQARLSLRCLPSRVLADGEGPSRSARLGVSRHVPYSRHVWTIPSLQGGSGCIDTGLEAVMYPAFRSRFLTAGHNGFRGPGPKALRRVHLRGAANFLRCPANLSL